MNYYLSKEREWGYPALHFLGLHSCLVVVTMSSSGAMDASPPSHRSDRSSTARLDASTQDQLNNRRRTLKSSGSSRRRRRTRSRSPAPRRRSQHRDIPASRHEHDWCDEMAQNDLPLRSSSKGAHQICNGQVLEERGRLRAASLAKSHGRARGGR